MIEDKITLLMIDYNGLKNSSNDPYDSNYETEIENVCKFIENNSADINRIILAKQHHPIAHRKSLMTQDDDMTKNCYIENNEKIMHIIRNKRIEYIEVEREENEDSASVYSEHSDDMMILKTSIDACWVKTRKLILWALSENIALKKTIEDLKKMTDINEFYVFMNNELTRI